MKIRSANAELKAKIATTLNLPEVYLMTNILDLASNTNTQLPETKYFFSTSRQRPKFLEGTHKPRHDNLGLQEVLQVDPPIFNTCKKNYDNKCFFDIIMDVAEAVHHFQSRKTFYWHRLSDQRT